MKKISPNASKRKPVILQVLPELKSGGVERGTVEIVKALVKQGYTALVASAGGHMVSQIQNAGGEHFELPLASKNPFTIKQNAKRLVRIIEEYDVDITHARSRAPAWSAYYACQNTGCHFVTTVHGTYSIGSKMKQRYNSVMMRGEKIIAVSGFIKKYILDNYEANAKDITVIHRGTDLEQFSHDKVSKTRIIQQSEKLKIEHDKQIILLPGRFTQWKGHEFLLDALEVVDRDKYLCLLVGNSDKHQEYLKRLQEKIEDLDLTNNVRIIDHVNDMPALYSLADIVVSASMRPEAFGRVATEAQAMERMLIATNHGGACETVIDTKTGWLVEPGDVDQLTQILEKLIKISDRQRKIVANRAKKHIKENFSLDIMTAKTLEVYDKVVKSKARKSK